MTFTHSMWLSNRSIVVVSVVMMSFLLCAEVMAMPPCLSGGATKTGGIDPRTGINPRSSLMCAEAMTMPPGDCSSGGATETGGIDPRTATKRAQCVPFHKCCDTVDLPFLGLIDERTTIDITDRSLSNQKCQGLNLCCTCVKDDTNSTIDPKAVLCGKRNADGVRIQVTGFEDGQTQQGEFPWTVALMTKDTAFGEGFVGGGSLVHPRVVLTAAHKVQYKTAENLIARIGEWHIGDNIESFAPQNIDVENILIHDEFNNTQHHYNVAILILKAEAKYGETVAPVCLPEPGQIFDGKNCFVSGWGKKNENSGAEYQQIMKKVSVPIIDHITCQDSLRKTHLGNNFELHSTHTCAGGQMEDACEGDGGGPLVCPSLTNSQELVQVGVVSWGIGCGIVGNPGVYGSVPEAMMWITKTIKDKAGITLG